MIQRIRCSLVICLVLESLLSLTEVWRHVSEICGPINTETKTKNSYVFRICSNIFAEDLTSDRKRREASINSNPRMFSSGIVRSTVINTAPVITTDIIDGVEDTDILYTIEYSDLEGDALSFDIAMPPDHGEANITSEGALFYSPDKDFNGVENVILKATEVFTVDLGIQPHEVTKRIYLNVSNINDQPVSFFQQGTERPVPSHVESIHRLYLEGNQTYHVLGSFWIADVDQPETLRLLQKTTSGIQAIFGLNETGRKDGDKTFDNMTVLYSRETISNHHLNVKIPVEYHGIINFSILAVDNMNSYSHPLMVEVFVLISPCYHGICAPTTAGLPCSHPTRAETFNPYRCQCEAGYEGEFCQQEINECLNAACSLLYDCEDRLTDYECILNTPKIVAISICILLPVIVLGIFIMRRYIKMKEMKIGILPGKNSDVLPQPVQSSSTALNKETPTISDADELGTGPGPNQQEFVKLSGSRLRPGYVPEPNRKHQTIQTSPYDADNEPGHSAAHNEEEPNTSDGLKTLPESEAHISIELPDSRLRPGYVDMPHRKHGQLTSSLQIRNKALPKVVS